ncbi:hypothetical protein ACQB60_44090 [Actinomycetota bacterium Odt1-20B]
MYGGLGRAFRAAGLVFVVGVVWSAEGGAVAAPALSPLSRSSDASSMTPGTEAPPRSEGPRITDVSADAAVAGPGDTVGWFVEVTGPTRPSGAPGHVDIDLSGVLASADLAGEAVVVGPGQVRLRDRSLRWTGDLGPGQHARIYFSATVHRTVERPVLSIPEAGSPVRLRGLELTVRAHPDEVSGDGQVTFQVTAKNVGAGGWTATDPATFDVDLKGLGGASGAPKKVRATAGSAAFTGHHLVWTGPLPAGRTVTVTFTSDATVRPGAPTRGLTVRASSELASGPCTPSGHASACQAEVPVTAPAPADGTPPERTTLYVSVGAGSVLAGLAGAAVLAARRRRHDTGGPSDELAAVPVQQEPKPAIALRQEHEEDFASVPCVRSPDGDHRLDTPPVSVLPESPSSLQGPATASGADEDEIETGFAGLYAALDALRADISSAGGGGR